MSDVRSFFKLELMTLEFYCKSFDSHDITSEACSVYLFIFLKPIAIYLY